jgi:hypothetical protein
MLNLKGAPGKIPPAIYLYLEKIDAHCVMDPPQSARDKKRTAAKRDSDRHIYSSKAIRIKEALVEAKKT